MERGSSSLRAAADVVIRLEKKAAVILVENDKQKDEEESKDLCLRLETIELEGSTLEKPRRAAIVTQAPQPRDEAETMGLTRVQQRVLEALVDSDVPLASREWQNRVSDDHGQPMTRDAFQKHRRFLAENGLAKRVAGHKRGQRDPRRKLAQRAAQCRRVRHMIRDRRACQCRAP